MYTVSKGPSKIVAKTRRGLSQNLERLESRREANRKHSESDNCDFVDMPKPVFHSNGKKTVHQRIQRNIISPEHEEIIKYVNETWIQSACVDSAPSSPTESNGSCSTSECSTASSPVPSLYYQDIEPNPYLRDFKPFDLEAWWGKRLFQNITNSL